MFEDIRDCTIMASMVYGDLPPLTIETEPINTKPVEKQVTRITQPRRINNQLDLRGGDGFE